MNDDQLGTASLLKLCVSGQRKSYHQNKREISSAWKGAACLRQMRRGKWLVGICRATFVTKKLDVVSAGRNTARVQKAICSRASSGTWQNGILRGSGSSTTSSCRRRKSTWAKSRQLMWKWLVEFAPAFFDEVISPTRGDWAKLSATSVSSRCTSSMRSRTRGASHVRDDSEEIKGNSVKALLLSVVFINAVYLKDHWRSWKFFCPIKILHI